MRSIAQGQPRTVVPLRPLDPAVAVVARVAALEAVVRELAGIVAELIDSLAEFNGPDGEEAA